MYSVFHLRSCSALFWIDWWLYPSTDTRTPMRTRSLFCVQTLPACLFPDTELPDRPCLASRPAACRGHAGDSPHSRQNRPAQSHLGPFEHALLPAAPGLTLRMWRESNGQTGTARAVAFSIFRSTSTASYATYTMQRREDRLILLPHEPPGIADLHTASSLFPADWPTDFASLRQNDKSL
jgi:hypothetical protein